MQPRIKVLIADDHPVYRSGLSRALATHPQLEIIGEAGDGSAALESIVALQPDVAVLDQHMPGRGGLDVLRELRLREIQTPVLLLTGSTDPADLHAALAAGAMGFVLKTSSRDVICDAITAVARGDVHFPVEMQGALAAAIRARGTGTDRPVLSEREQQVLRLTADGNSAGEIATALYLSRATVRTHLQSLYQKLAVTDRAAAVAKGMRLGLID